MPKLASKWSRIPVILFFLFWFSFFALFWSRAIIINDAGGMSVGHINMWGDWAAHFTMGSAMGYRELFLTESPFLIGARFSYPFVANFISGILIRLGVPFFSSFVIPSFIFSCVFVLALFYFFKTLLSNKVLAVVAALIFLLNGGLGFYYFGQDIVNSSQPLETLINPPHEYTRLDSQNIKWISVIDSMVIPQRAFALGFPVALIALGLIYSVVFQETKNQKQKLIVAAVLLGLLPLIHTHSFLASGIILFFWLISSLLEKQLTEKRIVILAWQWGMVGVISLALAVPLFTFFFAEQTQGFLQWYPGWLAKEFDMNWLVFWFKNWLVTPLLALAGLLVTFRQTKANYRLATLFIWLPFIFLFTVANLFLTQPFSWDNTKLIVWSSIGFAGLAAIFLQYVYSAKQKRVLGIFIATVLFLLTIASGAIDAYWIVRTDLHTYQMYSAEELALAEWVKANTPADAVFLTGDQHNHWLFNLTGRQSVLTYRGWLWTHGYDYIPIQNDVQTMYQQPERNDLFEKYEVDYVVIGPNEEEVWNANNTGFLEYFEPVKASTYQTIFRKK